MPRSVNLDDVVMVAKKLAALDTKVVFTGGSIVALLLDKYVCGEFARFLADTRFRESLPGHLPSDAASQQRLPGLEQKLHALVALPHA